MARYRHNRPMRRRPREVLEQNRAFREKENRLADALYDRLNPNADVEIRVSKADCIKMVQRGER